MSPEGLPYNQTYGTSDIAETDSSLSQRIDNPQDPFPDEDQYMRYLQNRVQDAIAEQAQPAQLDPRRDTAGPSTEGTRDDSGAVAQALATSTEFAAAVARHLVETTQQASRPDALPEEQFRGIYELGALGAGGIGLSGVAGVRPTGAAATMFTGRQGLRNLATVPDRVPVSDPSAFTGPLRYIEDADTLSAQGVSDARVIELVNSAIAREASTIPGQGRISDVFGGITRGTDGMWRLELSDHVTIFSPFELERFHRLRPGSNQWIRTTGRDLIHHPILADMYPGSLDTPSLNEIQISLRRTHKPEIQGGEIDTESIPGTIQLRAWGYNQQEMQQAVFHELQHYIQAIEGFAPGGFPGRVINPTWWQRYNPFSEYWREGIIGGLRTGDAGKAQDAIMRLPAHLQSQAEDIILSAFRLHGARFEGNTLDDLANYLVQNPMSRTTLTRTAENIDYNFYNRLSGEVEARVTSDRLELTGAERRETPFSTTNDYFEPDRQIVAPWPESGIPGQRSDTSRFRVITGGLDFQTRIGELQERLLSFPTSRPISADTQQGIIEFSRDLEHVLGQFNEAMRSGKLTRDELISIRPTLVEILERAKEFQRLVPLPGGRQAMVGLDDQGRPQIRPNMTRNRLPEPREPVTVENAQQILNELGLETIDTVRHPGGSTYITFRDPSQPSLIRGYSPRIRVPDDGHIGRDQFINPRVGEHGVTFDTGWRFGRRSRRDRRVTETEDGRPYSELSVLRETLQRRFRPDLNQTPTPEVIPDNPNQFRLFGRQEMAVNPSRPAGRYVIVDNETGEIVSRTNQRTRANTMAERRNQQYGAHRYYSIREDWYEPQAGLTPEDMRSSSGRFDYDTRHRPVIDRDVLSAVDPSSVAPREWFNRNYPDIRESQINQIHSIILDELEGSRLASRGWSSRHLVSIQRRIKEDVGTLFAPRDIKDYIAQLTSRDPGGPGFW